MQAPHNNKHKGPKFLDMKLFIAAMTLAITIGLWNLLSNNLLQADRSAPTATVEAPAQPPANVAQDPPPLPTLVPLLEVDLSKTSAIVPANNPVQSVSGSVQTTQLRSVAIPTPMIVQQGVIQVGSGGGGGGSGGGGGGGGGGGHHAASHSSHK